MPLFDPKLKPPITAVQLLASPEPEDHFIIEPRILSRSGRLVLAGLTGVGKSFLQLNLIRALIAAEQPFGCPELSIAQPGLRVLYIEKELGWGLRERVERVMAGLPPEDLERFQIMSRPPRFHLSSPECIRWLTTYCDGEGIDVICLDPLNKMHFWSENSQDQTLRITESFEEIQGDRRAIIYAHHFKKPPLDKRDYDPLDKYNIRGTLMDDNDAIVTVDRRKGKITPLWESWVLDASMEKTRHGGSIETPFTLRVNEANDFRVHWRGNKTPMAGVTAIDRPRGFSV